MMRRFKKGLYLAISGAVITFSLFGFSVNAKNERNNGSGSGGGIVGNVYTMTNSAGGNSVIIFNRMGNGALRQVGEVGTGGDGGNNEVAVDPLGSQNSMLLSEDGNFLFVVNNGSNDISSFRVAGNGRLTLVDVEESGGISPVSLAMDGDSRLLALNSREGGSIATFDVDANGNLHLNQEFALNLSEENGADMNVAPGQIVLDNLNRRVLVTNGLLDTVTGYELDNDGDITNVNTSVQFSAGLTFTMALTRFGHVLVAHATDSGGFQFNTGALSSVDFNASSPAAEIITENLTNGESATCWVVTDGNRFAYTTSTFSDTISSFSFDRDGNLELVEGDAARTNDGPIDLGLSGDGRFLFVLNAGAGDGSTPTGPEDLEGDVGGNISAYSVNTETGELSEIGSFGNLPASASIQGIAIR